MSHINPNVQPPSSSGDVSNSQGAPSAPTTCKMLAAVFSLLLDCMTTDQQTVVINAKGLQSNASLQMQINNDIDEINFNAQLPSNATQNQINQFNAQLQQAQGERTVFQNSLTTLTQQGSVKMQVANANVSYLEQASQQYSGCLNGLLQLYEAINSMSPASR